MLGHHTETCSHLEVQFEMLEPYGRNEQVGICGHRLAHDVIAEIDERHAYPESGVVEILLPGALLHRGELEAEMDARGAKRTLLPELVEVVVLVEICACEWLCLDGKLVFLFPDCLKTLR